MVGFGGEPKLSKNESPGIISLLLSYLFCDGGTDESENPLFIFLTCFSIIYCLLIICD
jgi:hypothetical protein